MKDLNIFFICSSIVVLFIYGCGDKFREDYIDKGKTLVEKGTEGVTKINENISLGTRK